MATRTLETFWNYLQDHVMLLSVTFALYFVMLWIVSRTQQTVYSLSTPKTDDKPDVPRVYYDNSNLFSRSIDRFRALPHGIELVFRGYKMVTSKRDY